jgi:ABC-type dipeptide/oligopeptide/nickel transport system permease subunit
LFILRSASATFYFNKNVHLIVAALPLLRWSDTEKVVIAAKLPASASQYSAAARSVGDATQNQLRMVWCIWDKPEEGNEKSK